MPTIPSAIVSHMVKGRLRIKVPCRRYDKTFFDGLTSLFSRQFPDVKVETNPLTGSTLFTGEVSAKKLVKFAIKRKIFKIENVVQTNRTLIGTVRESFKAMDRGLLRFTGGELDTASIIFLTLIGNGIYQIARGNFTAPAWYTAFWYALGVFSKSSLVDVHMIDLLDE